MKHILLPKVIKVKLLFTVLLFSVLSCATIPDETETIVEDVQTAMSETQEKVIEGARAVLGKTSLYIKGKQFNLDCSGTVMAVYYYAGIDLTRDFSKYSGGGTARIHQYLDDKELLYYTDLPVPGDIIFWDNTFDSNGDGVRNDYLTHVGIVVESSDDGTVTYLHEHYKKGIILETMNLLYPDDLESNSAMRMKGTGMEGGWLASHLYRESAMGYKLEE